ncbi:MULTISPECIES: DpnII family type II restriction endonuclease [unclassified Okeania]|uniref:DpnII family type II restriction endonuclease n=1 Tax=unclassified Okeania TaxID=2634635 RepID=UPI00338D76D9
MTGGAKSNALGHLAQKFVAQYIKDEIGIIGIEVKSDATLANVTHTDETTGRLTSFDIIVTKNQKYVAIEVSFQVTTNSVIERKGGEAKARYEQVETAGHKIAYVIDGAGNFERQSALQTICLHSHCTVAFSKNELSILCDFLRDYLENNNG